MDKDFVKTMLALHMLATKETFGEDCVVVLNVGEPGVYENNPTIMEYEEKDYKLCDANLFGQGDEYMEVLTFRKRQ